MCSGHVAKCVMNVVAAGLAASTIESGVQSKRVNDDTEYCGCEIRRIYASRLSR